jgi:hypothetical protein
MEVGSRNAGLRRPRASDSNAGRASVPLRSAFWRGAQGRTLPREAGLWLGSDIVRDIVGYTPYQGLMRQARGDRRRQRTYIPMGD